MPLKLHHVGIVEDNTDLQALWLELFRLEHGDPRWIDPINAMDRRYWNGRDVAVIDLHLGADTDGLTIIKWLRENYQETRIICISACPSSDPLRQAAEKFADGFLQKPFAVQDLLAAIDPKRVNG
jgi:DNA-binding response OmpR family regulator